MCYYVTPAGDKTLIGEVDPQKALAREIISMKARRVSGSETLDFNVAADGPPKPGPYTVECYLASGVNRPQSAQFTVVGPTPAADPSPDPSPNPAPAPGSAPTPSSDGQQAGLPTSYTLEGDMKIWSVGRPATGNKKYALMATWAGTIAVSADGTVTGKLPGTAETTVPMESATGGQYQGDYRSVVTFNVAITGKATMTPTGIKLELTQAVADHQVQPVTAVFGEFTPALLATLRDAIVEAAPTWFPKFLTPVTFEGTAVPLTQNVTGQSGWAGTLTLTK
jgi:hypothetical protein